MSFYKCKRCEYRFCSQDEIPYCFSCECENLEEIEDTMKNMEDLILEEHHIHPKFMDNKNGEGQKYNIVKKKHYQIHGKIMNWLWECIKEKNKKKVINYIINKSREFLGVHDEK